MFTFLTMTYNHQKYIIHHLESIKYQILTHGKNENFGLFIFDDCSKDKTMELVNFWLDKNQKLFNNIKININEKNIGINKNYINLVKNIPSERYKSLAGDDIYNQNDLINTLNYKKDLIISPVICFSKKNIIDKLPINYLLILKYNSIKSIKKMLEYAVLFSAPGVIVNVKLIQNQEYYNYISKLKYVEDWLTWQYLFFEKNMNLNIDIQYKPYILYRLGGISDRDNITEITRLFKKESEETYKNKNFERIVGHKINPYKNKYLNANYYLWYFLKFKIRYFDILYNKRIKQFKKSYKKELIKSKEFLKFINKKVEVFYDEIGVNFDE